MAEIIDGTKIKLGGKDYNVPPLNFKRLRQLNEEINLLSSVNGSPTNEQMDAMIKVVHSALERNYPNITLEDVEDKLDLANAGTVIRAIMGVSGMVAKSEGEA